MNLTLSNQKVCFVGAGAMAEAILRGMLGKEVALPKQLFVTNRGNVERLGELAAKYGVVVPDETRSAEALIRGADIVVLAMKPAQVEAACERLAPWVSPRQLIVSVIAGVTISALSRRLGEGLPIARTMPNTSSTIGRGATGLSFNGAASEEQRAAALSIFRAVGIVEVVDEEMLDVVTSVSGSGPAYIYYLMEAMIRSGVEGGLEESQAVRLTAETVIGAATMVKSTRQLPAELRRRVTSPHGTTHAAIEQLRERKFQESVAEAMRRCVERARELGETLG